MRCVMTNRIFRRKSAARPCREIMSAKTGNRSVFVRILLTVVVALLAAGAAVAQNDVEIEVALSPQTIGLNEQAILEVKVSGGGQNVPNLQMPALPSFEVYSQGSSSNFSIINGVVSSSVTYRYLLVPHKVGTFPIDGISLTVGGKQVVGNKVMLTVTSQGQSTSPQLDQQGTTPQGNTRDYFLQATVDKKNPYVNEQVTLTLRFCTAVEYYSSPSLDEPATTGFWTEVLGNKAPYLQKINNRTYKIIERQYALFPTQTGDLTIGRASITTTVATRVQRRDPFDLFGDLLPQGVQVTARSEPIKLTVKPLPTANKPEDFTGTVGHFEIEARPDRTDIEVNQPVTVTFKIQGTGNVKSVAEPTIPELPDFRIYRASSKESTSNAGDRLGGVKTYEEVFIPKRPGTLEIPALAFTYFDPDRNKYETIRTRAIPITVKMAEGYVASPDIPYSGPTMTIGSQAQDIRYIKDQIGSVHRSGQLILTSPLYLFVNGLPVAALVGLIVARKRREKLAGNIGLARARSAGRKARKRLSRARSLANLSTYREFYGELSLAVMAYVADKLNVSPHGMTGDQLADLLRSRQVPDSSIDEAISFLRQCDFARFAPATPSPDDLTKALATAEQVMVRMEEAKFA
ncbi:hypothetical protein C3F09_11940 [candidate division GN15 bacterium]|uniref:Protein BatD n=1 Tax=candidate division GN15 bacterium TaxID=2072418 RepID=A0A855WW12_9BACT|nr:MAG: hypothetical protein C3F09_11940 [candidate division GN15 bacterium]